MALNEVNIRKNHHQSSLPFEWIQPEEDYTVFLIDTGEKRVYQHFTKWIENFKLSNEIRGYHLEHCLLLIDYLACEEGIPIWAVDTRSLKNFLYKFYPKKVWAKYNQQKHVVKSVKLILSFMLETGFKLKINLEMADFLLNEKAFIKNVKEEGKKNESYFAVCGKY